MIDPSDSFPTTWTPNPKYEFVEPPKKRGGGRFVVCDFVGAVVGLFLSVALNANIWLPAGALVAFVLMAVGEGEK
jgi:hypothetical protein